MLHVDWLQSFTLLSSLIADFIARLNSVRYFGILPDDMQVVDRLPILSREQTSIQSERSWWIERSNQTTRTLWIIINYTYRGVECQFIYKFYVSKFWHTKSSAMQASLIDVVQCTSYMSVRVLKGIIRVLRLIFLGIYSVLKSLMLSC